MNRPRGEGGGGRGGGGGSGGRSGGCIGAADSNVFFFSDGFQVFSTYVVTKK